MIFLKKFIVLLLLATFSTTVFAITNAQVFAYAEANYPNIFSGSPTAGQYQKYSYRYYPSSQNYLGIDNTGVIYILGPYTGGVITAINTVSSYANIITTWEVNRISQIAGTWSIVPGIAFTVGKDGGISALSANIPTPIGLCFSDVSVTISNLTINISNYTMTGSYSKPSSSTGESAYASISGTFTSPTTFVGTYKATHGIANSFGVCSSSGSGSFTAIKK